MSEELDVLSQENGLALIRNSANKMAVAKIPVRELVEKVVSGQEYFCTDEGKSRVAEAGMAYITRVLPDGRTDTYMNKKGAKYVFEKGKTWDDLKEGQSAYGKLGDVEYDRSAIWVAEGTKSQAVWDEVQVAQGTNAFLTSIYNSRPNAESVWDRTQTVMNNNACDTHPVDVKRKDKSGNPVVIGVMPLTAPTKLREKELKEYVAKYYDGKMPNHLLPILVNIEYEKSAEKTAHVAKKTAESETKKKEAAKKKTITAKKVETTAKKSAATATDKLNKKVAKKTAEKVAKSKAATNKRGK